MAPVRLRLLRSEAFRNPEVQKPNLCRRPLPRRGGQADRQRTLYIKYCNCPKRIRKSYIVARRFFCFNQSFQTATISALAVFALIERLEEVLQDQRGSEHYGTRHQF
jgi:hypothetical protein